MNPYWFLLADAWDSVLGCVHIMLCFVWQQQIQLASGRLLVSGQYIVGESKVSHDWLSKSLLACFHLSNGNPIGCRLTVMKICTVWVEDTTEICYSKPDTMTGRKTSVWELLEVLLILPHTVPNTDVFTEKIWSGSGSRLLANSFWWIDFVSESNLPGSVEARVGFSVTQAYSPHFLTLCSANICHVTLATIQ